MNKYINKIFIKKNEKFNPVIIYLKNLFIIFYNFSIICLILIIIKISRHKKTYQFNL